MILWVDDLRQPPKGAYYWAKSVDVAKEALKALKFEYIDLDHDAGDFAKDGGDYIRLLDWMEETGQNYKVRLHTMNGVGRANMRAICEHNGWTILD